MIFPSSYQKLRERVLVARKMQDEAERDFQEAQHRAEKAEAELDALKAEGKKWERHIASAEAWRQEADALKAEVERLKTIYLNDAISEG